MPQWENFRDALSRGSFGTYFSNSGIVAVRLRPPTSCLCSLAGYGLAKFRFPCATVVSRHPEHADAARWKSCWCPLFWWCSSSDGEQPTGIIVPLAVDAFGIFLMRQFIRDLPDSLIEAARLDGCSEFGIFFRIILPNCKPALGALALLSFRDNWDQFLWPYIIASSDRLKTFPLGLAQMEGIDSAAYHEIMALAMHRHDSHGASVPALPARIRARHRAQRLEGVRGIRMSENETVCYRGVHALAENIRRREFRRSR